MLAHLLERLQKIQVQAGILKGIKRGIEREAIRTNKAGQLAQSPHPKSLGAKLTHPQITTDYSENLLEFITPVATNLPSLFKSLHDIHAYVYSQLGEDRLWPTSMPCILGDDQSIPIADYGDTNSGQMKMHYRRGLWHRYGKHMQMIAGMHYNFSLPESFWVYWHKNIDPCHDTLQDCIDANYMRMIRNYYRHGWIVYYLFGNSVAVDESFFVGEKPSYLKSEGSRTLISTEATTLRMTDMGYQSRVQETLNISYNNLHHYTQDLLHATQQPFPDYEKITEAFGSDAQLNPNILQIEAEYYAPIRPKRTVQRCERPVHALQNKGIEYIEIRALDIDARQPLGIGLDQAHFLEAFLLFCLLSNSPTFTPQDQEAAQSNLVQVALHGRADHASMLYHSKSCEIYDLAQELFTALKGVAELLDMVESTDGYTKAINAIQDRLQNNPQALLSTAQFQDIQQAGDFFTYAQNLAEQHQAYFKAHPLDSETQQAFEAMAQQSWNDLSAMKAQEDRTYQDYVKCYFKV